MRDMVVLTSRTQRVQKTEKMSSEKPHDMPRPMASPPIPGMPRLTSGPSTQKPNGYATAVRK